MNSSCYQFLQLEIDYHTNEFLSNGLAQTEQKLLQEQKRTVDFLTTSKQVLVSIASRLSHLAAPASRIVASLPAGRQAKSVGEHRERPQSARGRVGAAQDAQESALYVIAFLSPLRLVLTRVLLHCSQRVCESAATSGSRQG